MRLELFDDDLRSTWAKDQLTGVVTEFASQSQVGVGPHREADALNHPELASSVWWAGSKGDRAWR